MARIAGIDLPRNKRIEYALPYIYGIGINNARLVLIEAGVDFSVRTDSLTQEQIGKISKIIEAKYIVEGDLRREIQLNIKRLKDSSTYRGLRHIRHLPVRGQRTHTNARTRKGKRGQPITGKKAATKT